jgi:hypothetical protein
VDGHSVTETIAYLAAVADHEDELAARARTGADYVVTAQARWWARFRWLW